jgi:hypothetical protein
MLADNRPNEEHAQHYAVRKSSSKGVQVAAEYSAHEVLFITRPPFLTCRNLVFFSKTLFDVQ